MFQTVAKTNKSHCQISPAETEGRKRAEKLELPSWQLPPICYVTSRASSELSVPQPPQYKSQYTIIAPKIYIAQGKAISLRKKRVAKILSYQPTSTKPWNSQQMAGFATLLALPTLQGI